MTTETEQSISVSAMIRKTNDNTHEFLKHVADHIDLLESKIVELINELNQLKGEKNGSEE